jgi:hypothetical protein
MAFLEMPTSTQIGMIDGFETIKELTDQTFDDCIVVGNVIKSNQISNLERHRSQLDINVVKVKGLGRGLAF